MESLNKEDTLRRIENLKDMMNSPSTDITSLGYDTLLEEEWFQNIKEKCRNEDCAWGYSFDEMLNKMNPIGENAEFWEHLNEMATNTLKELFWDFIKKHI